MNYGILLAGGTGSRIGTDIPKQYIKAEGHMMATYAVSPLFKCQRVDKIYIVCDLSRKNELLSDIKDKGLDRGKKADFVEPGDNRQLSILNGLDAIMNDNSVTDKDTVIIQDAARPFLTVDLVEDCYKALEGHDGVMPALPMKDTVYLSKDGNGISGLLDRREIYAGQAPELFLLRKYYKANKALLPEKILTINGASEPAVLFGMDIRLIPGDENNIKITTDTDMQRFKEHMT